VILAAHFLSALGLLIGLALGLFALVAPRAAGKQIGVMTDPAIPGGIGEALIGAPAIAGWIGA
jgi:hypothetical protein